MKKPILPKFLQWTYLVVFILTLPFFKIHYYYDPGEFGAILFNLAILRSLSLLWISLTYFIYNFKILALGFIPASLLFFLGTLPFGGIAFHIVEPVNLACNTQGPFQVMYQAVGLPIFLSGILLSILNLFILSQSMKDLRNSTSSPFLNSKLIAFLIPTIAFLIPLITSFVIIAIGVSTGHIPTWPLFNIKCQ